MQLRDFQLISAKKGLQENLETGFRPRAKPGASHDDVRTNRESSQRKSMKRHASKDSVGNNDIDGRYGTSAVLF